MPTDTTRAYQQIKQKIISLELAPGAVIHDAELIRELGVGRTPIREALKLLEAERLVVTVPRRGIFVTHVSITDLQQITEVRMELEGLAARLAARRATADELEQLKTLAKTAADGNGLDDTATRLARDRELHQRLAAAAHNQFLEVEIERFYAVSTRLWYLTIERLPASEVDILAHQQIVEALEQRDELRAESLIREHIRDFQRTVKQAM